MKSRLIPLLALAVGCASLSLVPTLAAQTKNVTLQPGTLLMVRMIDGVSSKNKAGYSFTTRLESNLVADGVVLAPAGTVVYGKVQSSTQARRATGRSTLDIRLSAIVIGGTSYPLLTSAYTEEGASSTAKTAKAAAAGAIIGNNTGGSGGQGAAIGAGVAMLKRGESIEVPPGSLLEFVLTQPVTVTVQVAH